MATTVTAAGMLPWPLLRRLMMAALMAVIILAACLFGILTRPVGFLAAFWPANAILLGLMVRRSDFATLWGWLGAFLGYMAADLLTGGDFGITLWLTVGNMAGAFTGFLLFHYVSDGDRQLSRPKSVLYLFIICLASAAAAATVGAGAARAIFGRDFLTGFEFWFVTELVNNLIILPVLLAYPVNSDPMGRVIRGDFKQFSMLPATALFASVLAGVAFGGPGAIAFAVPALLWCALTYTVFATAVLTMCVCGWLLIAVSSGVISVHVEGDLIDGTASLRLGIALIALGPLTAAGINAARVDLVTRLAHAANHDFLTGVLNRRALIERASRFLRTSSSTTTPFAVLLLDIDHFKRINDTYGHAAGDMVLVGFAKVVSGLLRRGDLLGRVGGEEFAVILLDADQDQTTTIAERIRMSVETGRDAFADITVTVSIGCATGDQDVSGGGLSHLMGLADGALYRAKEMGRNRVEVATRTSGDPTTLRTATDIREKVGRDPAKFSQR